MHKTKQILFILEELKQNELYLNKVFTRNTGLLIVASFDTDTQKAMLQNMEEDTISTIYNLMQNEKQNADFDSRLTNFISNLND